MPAPMMQPRMAAGFSAERYEVAGAVVLAAMATARGIGPHGIEIEPSRDATLLNDQPGFGLGSLALGHKDRNPFLVPARPIGRFSRR